VTSNRQQEKAGTARVPNFFEGPTESRGDVRVHTRFFTYRTDAGLVAGAATNVMFTIDRPAKDVWPHFQDFNRWQPRHYYSGIVGDLEGKTFRISPTPDDPAQNAPARPQYQVLKVTPEYLIVLYQPVQEVYEGLPGLGGVSPGFGVFMLAEHGGKTTVICQMEHASLMEHASQSRGMTEEEALRPWSDEKAAPEWLRKWRDDFIPSLKKLVYEGQST
jgi:hypothetical protein